MDYRWESCVFCKFAILKIHKETEVNIVKTT